MPSFLEHLKNLATNSGIPGADKLTAPEILKLAAASTAVVVVSVVTTTLLIGSYIDFTQVAAPAAPAAGVTRAYGKTDGKLYKKTSDGVEVEVGGGGDLSNLSATNLTSGTVPDARFPATLPASSGVNLTALPNPVVARRVSAGTAATAATMSNSVLTSNVATITTAAAHGLSVDNTVTIAGSTHSGTFNGKWVVTSVPTTTTFTYAIVAGNISTASDAGSVTPYASTIIGDTPAGYTMGISSVLHVFVATAAAAGISIHNHIGASLGQYLSCYHGEQSVFNVSWAGACVAAGFTTAGSIDAGPNNFVSTGVELNNTGLVTFARSSNFAENNKDAGIFSDAAKQVRLTDGTTGAGLGNLKLDALYATAIGNRGPTVTVSNRAVTSNVATLNTMTVHSLAVGQSVTISGMTDATYSGTFAVASVPNTTTFTYALTRTNEGSTIDLAGAVTTNTWLSTFRTRTSNVATITTSSLHKLWVGAPVVLSGFSGAGYNVPAIVTDVPSTTTFTIANTGGNEGSTADTGGTVTFVSATKIGATWAEQIAFMASDQAFTSNTTLADLTGLSITIGASEIWEFSGVIFCNVSTSAELPKICVTGTSSPTAASYWSPGNDFVGAITNWVDFGTAASVIYGTGTYTPITLAGVVLNAADAGVIKIQGAQAASSATATTFKAGSYIKAKRLK